MVDGDEEDGDEKDGDEKSVSPGIEPPPSYSVLDDAPTVVADARDASGFVKRRTRSSATRGRTPRDDPAYAGLVPRRGQVSRRRGRRTGSRSRDGGGARFGVRRGGPGGCDRGAEGASGDGSMEGSEDAAARDLGRGSGAGGGGGEGGAGGRGGELSMGSSVS